MHAATQDASIGKRVAMQKKRLSFASHLLEQKGDIRVLQLLLGHKKLETTPMYAHVVNGADHQPRLPDAGTGVPRVSSPAVRLFTVRRGGLPGPAGAHTDHGAPVTGRARRDAAL